MKSPTVISLGGSMVVPDNVDTGFVSAFLDLIKKRTASGESFIIVVGGGKVCRRYQEAARTLGAASQEAQDWVGIYATRLNAELLRVAFGSMAGDKIVTDPSDFKPPASAVTIAAGWKPGWSTDLVCVLMAEKASAERLANISNTDFVYDKDPRKFPEAKKIEKISWADFRRDILPEKWSPGDNVPFDPVAAEKAEAFGLQVASMGGDLENFSNYLDGKEFKGTVIS